MTEEKYIELNTFLKIKGVASSGGEAKQIIRSEQVKVNGTVETRNKKKLHSGDRVEIGNKKFTLKAEEIKG